MTTDDRTAIDVGGWMRTLARSWWIVLGLTILGALAGAVLTLASPNEYTATSSAYIGQTTDANGNPMAGLNSNTKAATAAALQPGRPQRGGRERTGMGELGRANLRRAH